MGRRHYDLSMLPAGMRRYNLLLICAGFVLVVLGLFFQTPIWYIVKFLLRVLTSFLYIFVLFFRFIIWLLARPAQPDKPLPQVSTLPVFGQAQEAASTPFINVLFQWLALLLVRLFSSLSSAANLGNHPKNSFGCLAAAESSVLPPCRQRKIHVRIL